MTPEQRQEIIRLLEQGEVLSPEWARILFPPEKTEYELVYYVKEREEEILANTLAVPLQPVRTFGSNGGNGKGEWQNTREVKINGVKQSLRDEEGNVVYSIYDKRLVDCVWTIPSLAGSSGEQIDYPTQKLARENFEPNDEIQPKSCFCNSATSALSSWTSCVSDLICFACCRFIFSSSSTLLRRTCSL